MLGCNRTVMTGKSKVLTYILTLCLKCWTFILATLGCKDTVLRPPETILRFIFSDKRLEILEFLADTYYHLGMFWYEGKLYVLDSKIAMKVINRLDKGAHDYLTNSPLNTSFLGATSRLDIVGRVLFGLDLGALDGRQDELLEAMMTILHKTYALGQVKPDSPEFQNASQVLDARTKDILQEALDKSGTERSLAQLLHEAGGFDEAVDNMKLFLMAGSETTASSIPVLMYLITSSPDLQHELQEEADQYMDKITADAACTPPKLESATKELLRTYPIAPYISRQTHESMELEHVTIPAESDLRIFTWGIHRSPHIFNNAKTFTPQRFLKDGSNIQQQTQTWIPFGAGSRICIGQHLAWVEMRLILTHFLHYFKFQRVSQTRDLDFCVDWEHAVVHPDNDVVLGIGQREKDIIRNDI